MYCGSCNKEFGREPLKIYNGEWHCPLCLESLFPKPEIVRNFDNIMKYAESERLYHEKWLLQQEGLTLQKALRLCRESAYAHNPDALIAMGYYHEKNYLNPFASEQERVKSAYQYYKTVAAYHGGFRLAFCPSLAIIPVKDTDFKLGEIGKLTTHAMENIYALVSEATDDVVRSVFVISKSEVLSRLEMCLKIENPNRESLVQEAERFPTVAEFLTEICNENVLFGFQKADARLLKELSEFKNISSFKELDADNFIGKLKVTMWIMHKDGVWNSIEAGSKAEFSKAAEARNGQYVIAFWKNNKEKLVHNKPKIKMTISREVFRRYINGLAMNGMLYAFTKDDMVVAAKRVKAVKDCRGKELFTAVLEILYNGGLQ